MHCIGANVTEKIWKMITGDYPTEVNTTIGLPPKKRAAIGSAMVDSAPTIPSGVFEGNFRGGYLYDWIICMRVMLIQFPTDRCFAKSRTDAIGRLDLVHAICHTNVGIRTTCRPV